MTTKRFTTPGTTNWLLPANLDVNTPATITLKGAGGGGPNGGAGDLLIGTIDLSGLVAGVDSIPIKVGGKGGTAKGSTKGIGGTNGGGAGGNSSNGHSGNGGGGWTGVLIGATPQAIAAGGGGQGASSIAAGGDGGTATGQAGLDGNTGTRPGNSGGRAGTPSAGGVGGTSYSPVTNDGVDGSSLHGGRGNNGSSSGMYAGGGGGGGLEGGGGGGGSVNPADEGGGGGGSSLTVGLISVTTHTRGGGATAQHNGSFTIEYNAIPDQPVMSDGGNFDFNFDLSIDFDFSDPDATDTLSAADVQWQVDGGGWTEIDGATIIALFDNRYRWVLGGGTVAIDGAVVEFQIRTYDQDGAQGPWSDSVVWIAYDTPASATISAPLAGDTIDSHDPVLSWTIPFGAFRYQLTVFDVTGIAAVLAYTVVLGDGVTTDFDTDLPEQDGFTYVNATDLQLGVRWQQHDGVWSSWALTGVVTVDINPPLAPTLALTVDLATASVLAEITNPGSDPFPPIHNDLYRTDSITGEETLIASGLAIDDSYTDYLPGFNRDLLYVARAVTATGAFADSA